MTRLLEARDISAQIEARIPGTTLGVVSGKDPAVLVKPEAVLEICRFLKREPGLEFDFLVAITGVDYIDHLEVVYHLTSLKHNHSVILKTRVYDREKPSVPSVVSVWQGADLQEREVCDLMGIAFVGHPNLKRIMLWEGFQGHPLRKDYL
ncbi:MAG: NADH-quinone oxidoreductase subunit C [Chloroflexi bacterium]|nr:NADH-quinone oxidoreductase subunit C [Chloroflexota bacterium]